MNRAVSRLVGAVLLVASSIVGFAGPVSAIGVAPWVDASGPGGGTVYYYSANGFACGVDLTNTCHFLEVAGSDWDATSRKWSSNNHSVAGTSTALGNGAKNTSLIVAGNSTLGYAASDANAFVSDTGLGDWFLPSRVEVRLMDGGQYSSNFGEVGTSSQVNANWWHTYDSRRNSDINDTPKGENKIVLAVRAFSKSDSSLASVSVVGEVLTPGFDPSVTSYSVTTSESSVQLTAVAVGASSVLVGASSGSSSVGNGTQSAPISLEAGLNQVTLTVTAADSTSTSYTLNITREMPGYAVSFDGNGATGGSVPGVQAKTHGVDLTVASNSGSLVREGYTFAGWNTRAEGDGTAYAEGATYATDAVVTLYAAWTGNPLTVTYDAQGGSVVAAGSTASGGAVAEAPETPTLAHHNLTGWFASSSGGTAISFPYTHGRTADFTLYAQWAIDTYAVSFDGNGSTGGSVPGVQAKSHGVDLTVASNSGSLVREGYTFAGWNTRAEGDGTAYAEGATYATDAVVTLYAAWTGNPLTVTYVAQGGSVVADGATVVGGVITELPQAPIRAGFTFTGWFASSSGGTAISSPYTHGRTADFSLYAQWAQSSLYGLGSVTKIGTITTIDGVGNTFSAETSSSSVSLRYPADGLPANTVIDVYLVNDLSRAQGLVPDGGTFIVSLVVAWLAADGTVPSTAAGKPLSMTITNSTILAGAKTYAIVGGQVTLLGTASVDGLVTISITDDPEIVVVNPAATPPTTTTPPGAGRGGGSGGQPPSTQPPSTQPPSSQRPDAPSFVDSGNAAELVRSPGQGAGLVNGDARPVQIGTVRSPESRVAPSQRTPEQIALIREAAKELVGAFTSMLPPSSRTIIDVVNSETGAVVRGLLTDDSGVAIDVPAESVVVVGVGSVAMMVGGENSSITDSGALSVIEDSVFGLAGGGLGVSQSVQVVVMSTPTLVAEFVSSDDGTFMLSGTFLASIGPGDHTLVLSTEDVQVSLGIRITESAPRFELPVTGGDDETTDLLITLTLFLLVFGVLGLRLVAQRPNTDPERQRI